MGSSLQFADNGLHFITSTVVGWQEVFSRIRYQEVVVDAINFAIENRSLRVFSYVVMPNHLHMIVDCDSEKYQLSKVIERLKSFVAHEVTDLIKNTEQEARRARFLNAFGYYGSHKNRDSQFWIHRNHPIRIYSNEVFDQKAEYIEMNPVKAGYVEEPHYWRLSSANINSPVKVSVA